jgi:hypothetical protein
MPHAQDWHIEMAATLMQAFEVRNWPPGKNTSAAVSMAWLAVGRPKV